MSGADNVTRETKAIPRLLERYRNQIIPTMVERFNYKNKLQVPRLKKIVVNMGVGEAAQDIKVVEQAASELALITGQRPVITRAKKAISNFKIRKGDPVGCMVTLRGRRMYEFLDRLVSVAIPRIRDFRGLSANSFDHKGNYSFGISEQTIFPEIEYDKVKRTAGMGIVIATSAENKEAALELLKCFGVPFRT